MGGGAQRGKLKGKRRQGEAPATARQPAAAAAAAAAAQQPLGPASPVSLYFR